jgi:hypothetical protein
MKRRTGIFALTGLALLSACSPKTAPVGNRTAAVVSEDLSAFRPRYTATTSANPGTKPTPTPAEKRPAPVPTAADQPLHITRRLDMVLDTLAMRNRYVKHAMGYRIQLYVGTSRQEADDVKIGVYQAFPELNVYMSYSAPTYRLRVGDFINRMDVERYYEALKAQYPNAMIQNDKVEIRKSLLTK